MGNGKFWLWILAFMTGLAELPQAWAEDGHGNAPFFIVAKMNKSMDQALGDLKQAITNNNYVFIRQQNVDKGLTNPEQENSRVIFVYFCNFGLLNQALKIDRRVGVFLPCRITLIQTPDGVKMIAVNPKLISKHLSNQRLAEICNQLTRDYNQILEEAAL